MYLPQSDLESVTSSSCYVPRSRKKGSRFSRHFGVGYEEEKGRELL
jgi:hypothetical protein